jgi:acetyl/propionyl-CoA carboxylase alpha subunit
MQRDFKRIAVVNRGEPAMRLIHAVRELNRERNAGLEAVALYTDLDRNAMFVREADDAVCLGPATYLDELRRIGLTAGDGAFRGEQEQARQR